MIGARHQQAAGIVPPGAHERRQAGDGAHRIGAAAHALQAVVHTDGCRGERAVIARQLADLLGGNAADLGRTLGRPLQRAFTQCGKAYGVLRDVVVIEPVVRDEFVHQGIGQRGVGAGTQLHMVVALLGGVVAPGVDAHQLGAIALGALRVSPEMQIAGDAVAAPDEDELAVFELLDVQPHLAADDRLESGLARGGANGAVEQAGAELVKKARRHAFALYETQRAAVGIGQDGLRVTGGNLLEPLGDVVQRFVPAHRGELAAAFGADSLHRLQQAVWVIGALGIARDLGAQRAVRGGMVGVAAHADGHAISHGDEQGAGVGAVVRAGGAHEGVLGGDCVGRVGHGDGF